MAKLTALSLTKFKPAATRQEIPDDALTGLYFVVQPTNRKSWAVRYRHNGKPKKLTLGNSFFGKDDTDAAGKELTQRRLEAAIILDRVRRGEDPAAEKQTEKKQPADGNLFQNAVATFLDLHAQGRATKRQVKRDRKPAPATIAETKRYLESFADTWKDKPLASITKAMVQDDLDELAADSPVAANRAHTYLQMFFQWAVNRDRVAASPVYWEGVPEGSRERVLSLDEVRWFWQACTEHGQPFGGMFKLLLLTGQRRTEVAAMTDKEIADDLWTIPSSRTKNRREHVVPLSEAARAILGDVQRIKSKSGYIFTTTGETYASGWSRATAAIAKRMVELARKEKGDEELEIERWTLHDLRRSFSTHANDELKIEPHIVEAVLNHISGARGGVAGTYNKAAYLKQKKSALDAWGRYVDELVTGKSTGNVLQMRTPK
ncbi:MAG: site-specific integrase [Mesorhizobium sp.]|uniref:tyrosine-type recombinase/integrase n=1 Tax=Mesorhizobium sp. TaxID=1871066 RepID=UPI001215388D|nr:site-specific integrase [Mesorhizobium sp.]TIT07323.1 MAG: site-specific integrase [Mesorhizobium sp.]